MWPSPNKEPIKILKISKLWGPILFKEGVLDLLNGRVAKIKNNSSKTSHLGLRPEDKSNKVFNKGIAKGSKASIPAGGQEEPIKTSGDKLEWKNPQNTLKKAITSLTINNANPKVNPLCTCFVWFPR